MKDTADPGTSAFHQASLDEVGCGYERQTSGFIQLATAGGFLGDTQMTGRMRYKQRTKQTQRDDGRSENTECDLLFLG